DGHVKGRTSTGRVVRLSRTPDLVPHEAHGTSGQAIAMDGGRMDGFNRLRPCRDLSCYSQYHPMHDTPSLLRLARNFVIFDRTFSLSPIPSWGAHLELVAATRDGFVGDNPRDRPHATPGPGWGCDSGKITAWRNPATGQLSQQPS